MMQEFQDTAYTRLRNRLELAVALLGQKDEEVRYLKRVLLVIAAHPDANDSLRGLAEVAVRESLSAALRRASAQKQIPESTGGNHGAPA